MKKKLYIVPVLNQLHLQTGHIIALSMTEGEASKDGEVLVKENQGLDCDNFWGDDRILEDM